MNLINILLAVVFFNLFLGLYHRLFSEAKLVFTQAELSWSHMIAHNWALVSGTAAEGCGTLVSLVRRNTSVVSEVAQGLIALQFVSAALVLALVGGLILQRPVLGVVQDIRHPRSLFKVYLRPCGLQPHVPQSARQPAVKTTWQHICFLCAKTWCSLATLSQAVLQTPAHVIVSTLSTGVTMGARPTLCVLQSFGICFAWKAPRQNPLEPSTHVTTLSTPAHLPSVASASGMESSMSPSSQASPVSPLMGFTFQRKALSSAPSVAAPHFQHQLPHGFTPAQQQCMVHMQDAQQLHYEARLTEEVSQQAGQHEAHEEEIKYLQQLVGQEQQWRQDDLAYAHRSMVDNLQLHDMQLADQRQRIADQRQHYKAKLRAGRCQAAAQQQLHASELSGLHHQLADQQRQLQKLQKQLADQQQSYDQELTDVYQQLVVQYAEQLAEGLARQGQQHANALDGLRQHVQQLLASQQAERRQRAAVQQGYSQAMQALAFERESREVDQAQSTAQVQQLAGRLHVSQNMLTQQKALLETFCFGPTGYHQLQAALTAAVQKNAELREHKDLLTQSNEVLTQQAQAMRNMQHPVYHANELMLADPHGGLGPTPLGSGTFGTVERTCTGQLGPVVCKWAVNSNDEACLDVEADTLASLRHPSIVTYYGRVVDPIVRPSQTGIVMECMDVTLSTLITSGSLALDQVVDIGLQLSAGLDFLHQRGCMHGDLKPNNIGVSLVGGRCVAKLLDVGSFRHFPPGGVGSLSWDVPGQMPLVVAYAPPEYCLGRLVGDLDYILDPKVEVFVWGLILADMLGVPRPDTLLNGHLEAFVGQLACRHYQVMWPSASQVPERIRRLVEACLEYSPTQRPTMLAVTAAMTAIFNSLRGVT
ncbi:hypothetical protein WJX77_003818 [Trebouxia sp. C0004]